MIRIPLRPRATRVTGRAVLIALGLCCSVGAIQNRHKPPEAFSANAQVKGAGAAAASTLMIHVDRYTTDDERKKLVDAVNAGGPLASTLRASAPVGRIEIGDKKWTVRYARQQPTDKGRTIVLVIDEPMFFVGGGNPNAKPREGFDVAVVQFYVDDVGLGQGTMAAAAKLKTGGPGGVEVADYAEQPIKLLTVRKIIS